MQMTAESTLAIHGKRFAYPAELDAFSRFVSNRYGAQEARVKASEFSLFQLEDSAYLLSEYSVALKYSTGFVLGQTFRRCCGEQRRNMRNEETW